MKDKYYLVFLGVLAALLAFSVLHFTAGLAGDTPTYIEAMRVMKTGEIPAAFMPNRILTNFLGLHLILWVGSIIGIFHAWRLLNLFFLVVSGVLFYHIVLDLFESKKTALLAGLFLVSNYAFVVFGPLYLMDAPGNAFFMLSLFFTARYAKGGKRSAILLAAGAIGLGALFKEYALFGIIPIAGMLIGQNYRKPLDVFKKAWLPAVIALVPFLCVSLLVYLRFDFTYANWFAFNQEHIGVLYKSRTSEFIKSFGSLLTFLIPLFLGGLYLFIKKGKELFPDPNLRIFLLSSLLVGVPFLFWPGITQRVSFVTVPGIILFASVLFSYFEEYWYLFLIVLAPYIFASFSMEAILLKVTLPF